MFKLHIESSKDIDVLHIEFADGTSTVQTVQARGKPDTKKDPVFNENMHEYGKQEKRKDDLLDTDAEFGGVSQEVINIPEIDVKERPINVAKELQNFDF